MLTESLQKQIQIIAGEAVRSCLLDIGKPLPGHPGTVLRGKRVVLVISGSIAEYEQWKEHMEQNKTFLQKYNTTWPELTKDFYTGLVLHWWRNYKTKTGFTWQIYKRGDDGKLAEFIGDISLNTVTDGQGERWVMGFGISESYARQGYMTEVAKLVINFALNKLKLHRVEAHVSPENDACWGLLEKLGFKPSGYKVTMPDKTGWVVFGKNNDRTSGS